MRLSQLNRDLTASFDWDGETVTFKFRPTVVTPEFEDLLRDASTGTELSALLSRLVSSIDIIDDDGDPISCDEATFHTLIPSSMQALIWRSAMETIRPKETTTTTSDAG